MKKLMILDDEKSILSVVKLSLEKEGWSIETFSSPTEAIKRFEEEYFDILLTDLTMPEMTGLEVLEKVKQVSPQTGVIVMTAFGTMKVAIEAMRLGAHDFIPKPFELKQLSVSLDNVFDKMKLKTENKILRTLIAKKDKTKEIIGKSPKMAELLKTLEKVAQSDAGVLITGETGSGKELMARKVHQQSKRKERAFIPINCSAIPENLLESELFGYRKGAFTGAEIDKAGLFQACDQGTLFLDEIGDMPFGLQAKLLRVLAEGKFIPLGSTQEKEVDVRVIAATHQNLEESIKKGEFREDLYYRLNIVELRVPPLRERKEDIPLLSQYFLEKVSREYSKTFKGFSIGALEKLENYHYPGNIRELEHIIEQSVIFEDGQEISEQHVHIREIDTATVQTSMLSGNLEESLEKIERDMVLDAMRKENQVKAKAAKRLGITFRSLRYRLKKLGMDDEV